MTLSQKAFSLLQYPLPQHALSRLTGKFAQCDNPWVKDTLIKAFIKRFKVDMSQALEPDPTAYATFNDFFYPRAESGCSPTGRRSTEPCGWHAFTVWPPHHGGQTGAKQKGIRFPSKPCWAATKR
ncbi:hypothetical protein HAALTHF_30820n [Vreelandella aquamarina]|nr:hypothetical protein HAALTHF_30820n [Halomonas axialensis]